MVAAAGAALVLLATRRGRRPRGRGWLWLAVAPPAAAAGGANSFGWIFTEMGRQPWAVFGLMTTERRSPPG